MAHPVSALEGSGLAGPDGELAHPRHVDRDALVQLDG